MHSWRAVKLGRRLQPECIGICEESRVQSIGDELMPSGARMQPVPGKDDAARRFVPVDVPQIENHEPGASRGSRENRELLVRIALISRREIYPHRGYPSPPAGFGNSLICPRVQLFGCCRFGEATENRRWS